jgi:SAM-dependent methyltransferase
VALARETSSRVARLAPSNASAVDLPRFKEALDLLKRHDIKANVLVDLGCGDGSLTIEMAKVVGASEVYCVDVDAEALNVAASRGLRTFVIDLSSDRIPLPDESVDLATALEVIEHLVNPDNMLREVRRVLRAGGHLLLTTPNLASWVNRLLLLFGYQPYNCEVSTEVLAGVPWRDRTFAKPSGHIRPFTLKALKELLTHHGFEVVHVKGAPGVEPKELRALDSLLSLRPSLARRLVVLARKA